jgi:hypothetical protein
MSASTQSVREIVATQPSAARILRHFDIDLRLQADESLEQACAELQLSVDQVLDTLADAETDEYRVAPTNPHYIIHGPFDSAHRPRSSSVRAPEAAKADAWIPLLYSTPSTPSEPRYGRMMMPTNVRLGAPPSTKGYGPQCKETWVA